VTGFVRVTEKLLLEWPNIDRHDRRWPSALVKSAKLGYYDIVKLLVEAGCDYSAKVTLQDFDLDGRFRDFKTSTALESASYEGHDKIVHFLLKHQAELGGKKGRWGSALEAASAGGCENIANIILDTYSSKQLPNPPYQRALLATASAPETTDTREVLKVLVEAVSRETSKNVLLEYPEILEKAVKLGDGKRVRTLSELGANVHHKDKDGDSPFFILENRERGRMDWDKEPKDSYTWHYYNTIEDDRCDLEEELKVLREYDPRGKIFRRVQRPVSSCPLCK
jgi:hypothetical protein